MNADAQRDFATRLQTTAIGEFPSILECKTAVANAVVSNAKPDEPAGFRSAYHAQYAVVIGPAFKNEASLDAELLTHQVALWTVDDLIRCKTVWDRMKYGSSCSYAAVIDLKSSFPTLTRNELWDNRSSRALAIELRPQTPIPDPGFRSAGNDSTNL